MQKTTTLPFITSIHSLREELETFLLSHNTFTVSIEDDLRHYFSFNKMRNDQRDIYLYNYYDEVEVDLYTYYSEEEINFITKHFGEVPIYMFSIEYRNEIFASELLNEFKHHLINKGIDTNKVLVSVNGWQNLITLDQHKVRPKLYKRAIALTISIISAIWFVYDIYKNGLVELVAAMDSFSTTDQKGRLLILILVRLVMLGTPLIITMLSLRFFFKKKKSI